MRARTTAPGVRLRPMPRGRVRPGRRVLRRGGRRPGARRPLTPAQRRRRRWRWAALVALLALLLVWLLWPDPPPPPPVLEELPPVAVGKPAAPKPPPPKPILAAQPWSPPRALLRAAILERASDLSKCELPPGAPPRLVTNLRIAKGGAVRGVKFANAEPIPPALAQCARSRMQAWNFAELKLLSDVEVLVTFRLGS